MEWISVKDRLPKIEEEVLVSYLIDTPDDTILRSQKVDWIHCIRQYHDYQEIDWASGTEDIDVTHWMPLPKPPKQ